VQTQEGAAQEAHTENGQATGNEGETPERRERRSRDRYGRDRRERQPEQRSDASGEAAFVAHDAAEPALHDGASNAEAPTRSYFERAATATASAAPAEPVAPITGMWSAQPAPDAAPVQQAAPATEAVAPAQVEVVMAAPAPTVEPAPAPVAVAVAPAPAPAPAAAASSGLPKVQAFALPVESLIEVANSSGLQWVNSDPTKIAAVQAAIAAEPKPTHVPRERAPMVVADEGPLVLVETRKDLSEMKLPF
jgi:ribonuclease E